MRINKYLASIGVASRRSIDEMIEQGRVSVNGIVAELGQSIDPDRDKVSVDGREVLNREEEKVYIILNKPAGYTSTVAKIKGEKNVLELVQPLNRHPNNTNVILSDSQGSKKKILHGVYPERIRRVQNDKTGLPRLYPVGRLDRDSTGLILLTNDGELAQKLTHPKFHIPKTYEVMVLGKVGNDQLEKLKNGVELEDGKTKRADVKIKSLSLPHHSVLEITLYQGKKRQIRRMMSQLHLHILNLSRISLGPVRLGSIPIGKYRKLTLEEIEALKSA